MYIISFFPNDDNNYFNVNISPSIHYVMYLYMSTSKISFYKVNFFLTHEGIFFFSSIRLSSVYHMIPLRTYNRIYQSATDDITNDNVMLVT